MARKTYTFEAPDGTRKTYVFEDEQAAQPPAAAEPKSLRGFAGNLASSAGRVIGDLAKTAALPVVTGWEALTGLKSGIEGAVRESQPGYIPPPRANLSDTLSALGQGAKRYVTDRYGSLDAVGNTLYTDPLGVAMDASALAGGTGAALRGAGAITRLPRVAKLGSALTTAADVANPISAVPATGRALAAATAPVRERLAERFMTSAISPPLRVKPPKARELTQTAIAEGVPASVKGYRKAEGIVDDLQIQVNALVARGEELGLKVDPVRVGQYLEKKSAETGKSIRDLFSEQVNPKSDLSALDQSLAEYLGKHTPYQAPAPELYGPSGTPPPAAPPEPPTPYSIGQAQAEKVGTYRQLGKKAFGELKGAESESQKALARGLRNEIAGALEDAGIPGINELNKREGKLIDLMDELERVVAKEQKTPPGQIAGPLWAGAAGGVVGGQVGLAGPVGAAAALLRYAATHPEFSSKLALAISSKSPASYPALRGLASSALGGLKKATPVASRALAAADSEPKNP